MSRIRSVKPEFWTSQIVAKVSRDARLVFIGLWNEADDEGRLVDAPKRLAGALFPFDDEATAAWMDARMAELAAVGLVVRYEVDGCRFAAIPSFREHQHPDKPRKSTLPAPDSAPTPSRVVGDSSPTPPRLLPDESGGDMDRDRDLEKEGRGSALPPNRGRQNPDAPPPLPGRLNGKGVGFMENPATFPQTVDALLEQHGAELAKEFPQLDGRSPRPSLADAVRSKWPWYLKAREAYGGGHANAMGTLRTDLAKVARDHSFSWERDRQTVTESTAAASTKAKVLKPLEGPPPADDPETAAAASKAIEAMKNIGRARAPPGGGDQGSGKPATTGG